MSLPNIPKSIPITAQLSAGSQVLLETSAGLPCWNLLCLNWKRLKLVHGLCQSKSEGKNDKEEIDESNLLGAI